MRDESHELKRWLEEKEGLIAARWRADIRVSESGYDDENGQGFLGRFLDELVYFLPHCLGESREVAGEVWQQATHLYGSFSLMRGLSAGEVVEELQLLRGVILRLLFEASPELLRHRGFKRDILILNEVLDLGVVRASVAYVDDLFFAHLQGSGVPEGVSAEMVEEMDRQMKAFREDLLGRGSNGLMGGRIHGEG